MRQRLRLSDQCPNCGLPHSIPRDCPTCDKPIVDPLTDNVRCADCGLLIDNPFHMSDEGLVAWRQWLRAPKEPAARTPDGDVVVARGHQGTTARQNEATGFSKPSRKRSTAILDARGLDCMVVVPWCRQVIALGVVVRMPESGSAQGRSLPYSVLLP